MSSQFPLKVYFLVTERPDIPRMFCLAAGIKFHSGYSSTNLDLLVRQIKHQNEINESDEYDGDITFCAFNGTLIYEVMGCRYTLNCLEITIEGTAEHVEAAMRRVLGDAPNTQVWQVRLVTVDDLFPKKTPMPNTAWSDPAPAEVIRQDGPDLFANTAPSAQG